MTPDTAAIAAVTQRLHEAAKTGAPCDLEACASLAVTTLQALGWQPPRRRDTTANEAWNAYGRITSLYADDNETASSEAWDAYVAARHG